MDELDETVINKKSVMYDHFLKYNSDPEEESSCKSLKNDQINKKMTKNKTFFISDNDIQFSYKNTEKILRSELMFKEDSNMVENLRAYKKAIDSHSSIKTLFYLSPLMIIMGIAFYSCNTVFYCVIALSVVIYIGYCLFQIVKQYFYDKELDNFLAISTSLHRSIFKSYQLINEFHFINPRNKNSLELVDSPRKVINNYEILLKRNLIDLISILQNSSKDVCKEINEKIPECYLCLSEKEADMNVPISTLSMMYLLSQSQFVRILGLCFCTQFWTCQTRSTIKQLYTNILPKLTSKMTEINTLLDDTMEDYRYNKMNEIIYRKDSLPEIFSSNEEIYKFAYRFALSLQDCTFQAWKLVSQLETAKDKNSFKNILYDFNLMRNKILKSEHFRSACSRKIQEISLSIISAESQTPAPETPSASVTERTPPVIDVENDEQQNDELFELYLTDTDSRITDDNQLQTAVDETLTNFHSEEAAKSVLDELKSVLVVKQSEWKERERKIRKTQNESTDSQTNSGSTVLDIPRNQTKRTSTSELVSSEDEDADPFFSPCSTAHVLPHPRRVSKYKNVRNKYKLTSSHSTNDIRDGNTSNEINLPQHPIGFGIINIPRQVATACLQDEESITAEGELSDES